MGPGQWLRCLLLFNGACLLHLDRPLYIFLGGYCGIFKYDIQCSDSGAADQRFQQLQPDLQPLAQDRNPEEI